MAIFNQTSWDWSKDHREVLIKNADIRGERKLGIGGTRRVRPQSPPAGSTLDLSVGSGSPRSEASPPRSPPSPGTVNSTLLSGDEGNHQNLPALHGAHSVEFDQSNSSIGSAGYIDSPLGSGAADRPQSPRDALEEPPPRTFLQGVTWGYAVIRAVDGDNPAALRHSLQPIASSTAATSKKKKKAGKDALHGVNPNAIVDGDGYGGFKWSAWTHRCSGDSVLHLLLRWRKLNALAGLYAVALEFERHDPARIAAEEADDNYALAIEGKVPSDGGGSDIRRRELRLQAFKSFVLRSPESLSGLFDLQLRDAQGATASELCREVTGRTLPQFWRHAASQARARAASDAAEAVASLAAQRVGDHAALVSAMQRAAAEYREAVQLIGTHKEIDTLLSHGRVVVPRYNLQTGAPLVPSFNPDGRLEARKHLWAAAGLEPPKEKSSSSAAEATNGQRPGSRADDFPVDTREVEHGALREWLEKVRDGRRTVTHLTARHDLKYGGCLSVSGAAHLSACLPACPHLTTMCLRGHRVGLQGGKLLARGLKQAPALTYLDLSANALTAHGAVPLCAALVSSRGGRRLQVLLLDANRIEGDGCCAVLATGLRELRSRKRLPALSHLSLSNNPKLIGLSRLHAEVSEVNAAKINGSNGAEEKEGGASSGDKERLEPLLVVFPKATLPVESP